MQIKYLLFDHWDVPKLVGPPNGQKNKREGVIKIVYCKYNEKANSNCSNNTNFMYFNSIFKHSY